jgi:hypothetical protein
MHIMTRVLLLLLSSVLCLSACVTTGKAVDRQKTTTQSNNKLSMIDISRGLSDGAVDVYESEGPLLTKPVPPSGKHFSNASVPVSKDILTNDPSVVIYDSSTGQPIQTRTENNLLSQDELEPPIPPIDLPDLQPPVEALGELPSPFDKDGNLLPDEKL